MIKIRPEAEEDEVPRGEVEQIHFEYSDGTRMSYTFPFGVSYYCAKYDWEIICVEDGELYGWREGCGDWQAVCPEDPPHPTIDGIVVLGKKKN